MDDVSPTLDTLILVKEYAAWTPEELFTCWTEPALLTRWWPPRASIEPWLCGRFTLSWPEVSWELYGSYTAWEPGRQLGFTWQWRHEPDVPLTAVLVTFAPLDTSGTSLTIQHGPYTFDDDDQQRRAGHREGWTYFCAKLHELEPGYSI